MLHMRNYTYKLHSPKSTLNTYICITYAVHMCNICIYICCIHNYVTYMLLLPGMALATK